MSFENVVLLYPHPHIAVYLEDNTEYTQHYAEPVDESVKMLQCGMFAEGKDNVVQYIRDIETFLAEYGEPNYKLYGQAGYNVDRALRTGYASAYVMRVMPTNATYANVVIMVKYGIIEVGGVNKLALTYTTQTISNATKKNELTAAINALYNDEPDKDGFYTNPLFCVYSDGRGEYGNNYRFRISDVTNYEDEPDYRDYRFEVLRMKNTLKIMEYAKGSFYDPDLFSSLSKESLYLEDLINDEESGLGKVNIMINEDIIQDILTMYNESVLDASETPLSLKDMDIIYGLNMDGSVNEHIEIVSSADSVSFTSDTEGVFMFSGSDGDFSTKADASVREQAYEDMLVAAYSGELDRHIKSKWATPADFMLDAGFSNAVKKQMAALSITRQYDCSCYLDAGIVNSVEEAVTWLETMSSTNDSNVYKEFQHYKYRDTIYTGKSFNVTTTHYLAGLIPTHFMTVGLNIPMAMSRARIDYAVKGSFGPIIEPDDHEVKKVLYLNRANYYETVRYNVYQRGVVNNTYKKYSDYMDEYNKYIVNYAVEIATDLMMQTTYNFAEEEDRRMYQNIANMTFASKMGHMVRSCTVEYSMSPDDEIRSILRIKIRIVFKTVAKRGIIEVYLDPRNTESSLLVKSAGTN